MEEGGGERGEGREGEKGEGRAREGEEERRDGEEEVGRGGEGGRDTSSIVNTALSQSREHPDFLN